MLVPKICFPDDINANPENYEEFIEVKLVKDDDGHNYVIPTEFEQKFEEWQEMDSWYQDEEKEENRIALEVLFEQFRTGGAITTKLYTKVQYEQEDNF